METEHPRLSSPAFPTLGDLIFPLEKSNLVEAAIPEGFIGHFQPSEHWVELDATGHCHDLKSKQAGDLFAQFKPYSDVKQAMQVVVHAYFKQRKENETSHM